MVATKSGTNEAEFYTVFDKENYIQIRFDTGTMEVKSIELAARKLELEEDFQLITTIHKNDEKQANAFTSAPPQSNIPSGDIIPSDLSSGVDIFYIFRNTEILTALPPQETNRLFDDLPQLAKSQELVDGNRLVYGNIVNGYNPVDIDADFDVVYRPYEINLIQENIKYSVHAYRTREEKYNCTAGWCFTRRLAMQFQITFDIPWNDLEDGTEVVIELENLCMAARMKRHGGAPLFYPNTDMTYLFAISVRHNFTYNSSMSMSQIVSEFENNAEVRRTDLHSWSESSNDFMFEAGYTINSEAEPAVITSANHNSGSPNDSGWISGGSAGQKFWGQHNNDINFNCMVYMRNGLGAGDTSGFLYGYSAIGFSPSEWNDAVNNGNSLMSYSYGLSPIHTQGSLSNYPSYFWGPTPHNAGTIPNGNGPVTNVPSHTRLNYWWYNVLGVVDTRTFKSGGEHGLGIVYYDRANRSTTVNKAGEVHILFPSNRPRNNFVDVDGDSLSKSPTGIHFSINHAPPDWATHYQFVYTGCRTVKDCMQIQVELEYDSSYKGRYTTVLDDSLDETSSNAGTYQGIVRSTLSQRVVKMSMAEMIDWVPETNQHKVAWQWQEGDRMRFINYKVDGVVPAVKDVEIIGIQESIAATPPKLYYILDKTALEFVGGTLGSGVILTNDDGDVTDYIKVEIYRPEKNTEDNAGIYYEFGHVNDIAFDENGNRVHTVNNEFTEGDNDFYIYDEGDNNVFNNKILSVDNPSITPGVSQAVKLSNLSGYNTTIFQNQRFASNGTLERPATGILHFGDTHFRTRLGLNKVGPYVVEDYSFTDYYASKKWGRGRPNAYLPDYKKSRRDSTIFYSEPYIPNTKINGLSTFYPDISFQEYDKKFNSIQKLHSLHDSLIIFQEDKISRAMVSRDVIFDATAEQNVAISKNVLSPAIPYVGEYGICKNPESFASFGFRSYFFDIRRGAVMRLSQDGLTPISEARMKNFFTDYSQEVMDRFKLDEFICYSAYDDKFDEYVISVPTIKWTLGTVSQPGQPVLQEQVRINGFTVGFNETGKRWNSFYSYSADWLESFSTGIVSWDKNGGVFQHNISTSPVTGTGIGMGATPMAFNNFYNVDYPSKIDFPSNVSPGTTKIYNTIIEESTDIWEVEINTRNRQRAFITTQDFTNGQSYVWQEGHGTKENVHHTNISGDVNSLGGKIEGDRIRDTSIMASLTLPIGPAQEENTLFSVKFGITPSGSPDLLGNVA